jgi:hypothetical protein
MMLEVVQLYPLLSNIGRCLDLRVWQEKKLNITAEQQELHGSWQLVNHL